MNQPAALSRQAAGSAVALLLAALTGLLVAASNALAIAAPVLLAGWKHRDFQPRLPQLDLLGCEYLGLTAG